MVRITATNRGTQAAPLHVIPQIWFRNEWSWAEGQPHGSVAPVPNLPYAYTATHRELGTYRFSCEGEPREYFVENETNSEAVFGCSNAQPYVKDGIDRAVRGSARVVDVAMMLSEEGNRLLLHEDQAYAVARDHREGGVAAARRLAAPTRNCRAPVPECSVKLAEPRLGRSRQRFDGGCR